MVVFHKLCRTTWSSRVSKTESVSAESDMVGGSEFQRVRPGTAKLLRPISHRSEARYCHIATRCRTKMSSTHRCRYRCDHLDETGCCCVIVTSRVDYCNGVLHRVSAASVRPLLNLLVPQLESYCVSGSSTTSPLTFEIDYIGCPFSRELNTKCVSWCTSVCIRLHQETCTSTNCALNQPVVVTFVQLHG